MSRNSNPYSCCFIASFETATPAARLVASLMMRNRAVQPNFQPEFLKPHSLFNLSSCEGIHIQIAIGIRGRDVNGICLVILEGG